MISNTSSWNWLETNSMEDELKTYQIIMKLKQLKIMN